jgi:hypothetical protein
VEPSGYLAPEDVESLLSSWERLNKDLMGLPLPAVAQLLTAETFGLRRPRVIQRLYGRFHKLRAQKELEALQRGEAWPVARWLLTSKQKG